MSYGPDDPQQDWDPLDWEPVDSAEPEPPNEVLPSPWEAPTSPGRLDEQRTQVVFTRAISGNYRQSRNPATAMLVGSILLAMFGLVGIGIGIDSIIFNRDAPIREIHVVGGPTVVSAPPIQSSPLQAPIPVPQPAEETTGSDRLTVVPDPVVEVARAVIPSVVLIEITGSGQALEVPGEESETPEDEPALTGQGSGIIYDASGLILTNAHVVGEVETVTVQFADGTRIEGTVIGTAPAIDVALLRVDTDMALTPAVFADRSTVEVGQLAVAVGSPFGLQQSVTSGIVSAVARAITGGEEADRAFVEMIQTDAPINPGNSGGALANRFGQVIGMNTLIQTDGSIGNIGLGFAIPSDIALNIAQRILAGESTELGYLGIWGSDPLMGNPGALIEEVASESPAEQAGLMAGDLIVLIDDEAVSTMAELAAKVQFRVPGTEVELQVVRDDVQLTLTVVIGSRSIDG